MLNPHVFWMETRLSYVAEYQLRRTFQKGMIVARLDVNAIVTRLETDARWKHYPAMSIIVATVAGVALISFFLAVVGLLLAGGYW